VGSGILILLVLIFVTAARAHGPYEISSVVYLQSNHIELSAEMEFPTGLMLAGLKPSSEAAAARQFEAALPQLRELAGSFYKITAGGNLLVPGRTNVELGVEGHIRFQLDFALTTARPLRFVLNGLKKADQQMTYGASLAVLDMVNRKILSQTMLFNDAPVAEFLAASTLARPATNTAPVTTSDTNSPAPPPASPTPSSIFALVVGGIVGVVVLVLFCPMLRRRS